MNEDCTPKIIGLMDGAFESINRVYDLNGIAPTINTCGGGHREPKIVVEDDTMDLTKIHSCAIRGRYTEDNKTEQQLEIGSAKTANAITSVAKDSMLIGKTKIANELLRYRIRKLTPRECFRLMDFTDEEFDHAASVNSNTQLLKEAGNSIVVNTLVAIFGQLFEGKEDVYRETVA